MSSGRIPSVEGGIQPTIVDAKGDLIVATAADTVSRLAVGTNDYVLTADSSTATGLKWDAAGGLTLLSTTTLSGSTTTVSGISGNYKDLQIYIYGVNCSSDAQWFYRVNDATTVTMRTQDGATQTDQNDQRINLNTDGDLKLTDTNNAFVVQIYNYASSSNHKPMRFHGGATRYSTFGNTTTHGWGRFRSNNAVTSFVFGTSAGTFSAGTIQVYGVK